MHLHSFPGRPLATALRAGALVLGLGGGAGALASDAGPSWSFSGFGTLGVVHSSEKNADFTSSVLKRHGAGRTHSWSPNVDSRLGAQLDLSQGRWSAVLQVISEQRLDGSYRPELEWANVKYQLTPDLALRAGRIALPMFLSADYRKVGYTVPWVRPPAEVYGTLPIANSDGVDVTWRWSAGAVRNATQVHYGRTDLDLNDSKDASARDMVGLSHSLEAGAFSARASVIHAKVRLGIGTEMFSALRQFGPQGTALAERYEADNVRATVYGVGFSYDPGHWFVTAETGRIRTDSFIGKTRALYGSVGYRHGPFTPYLAFARVRSDEPIEVPALSLHGLPPRQQAALAGLRAGLDALLRTIPVQRTVTAGLRWDLVDDFALKLQYDRVTPQGGSRGTLINTNGAFNSGDTAHVASIALDFVF
jgi:hypothetical protein